MFVNYVRQAKRGSPLNLATARVLFGIYLLWKLASVETAGLDQYPILNDLHQLIVPEILFEYAFVEQYLAIFTVLLFTMGYYLRIIGFAASVLVGHFGVIIWHFNWSGNTQAFFMSSILLILFALFAEQDLLSVDGFRHTKERSLKELNSHLKSSTSARFGHDPLRWFLVLVGILYFGSGLAKIRRGPWDDWGTSITLGRFLQRAQVEFGYEPWLGDALLQFDFLLQLGAVGTLILETGFIFAIISGVLFSGFVVALIFFHLTITAVQGPVFFDLIVFLLLFVAWDRLYRHLSTTKELDLVYDERCYFCARTLYLFKYIDIYETVSFYSQSDAPPNYSTRDGVDFDDEMYVFIDGDAFGGYWAFQKLFKQFAVTAPLSWLMRLSPVSFVGEHVYRYVAKNRDRYFVCSYN